MSQCQICAFCRLVHGALSKTVSTLLSLLAQNNCMAYRAAIQDVFDLLEGGS